MNIVALIPARSGSKSVINKNIMSFQGKPLISYSIEQGIRAKRIDRVVVSTDSAEYAEIARSYGAETPFLRPASISQDDSTDFECFLHAYNFFVEDGYHPDIFVHLRPTYPIRKVQDIDDAIGLLQANEDADSVRSVTVSSETPYKMWTIEAGGRLRPIANLDTKDFYNTARQTLPVSYIQNAAIDVFRAPILVEKGSVSGDVILPFVMDDNFDIDTYDDFEEAKVGTDEMIAGMEKICFDIDGVIANLAPENDYSKATPNMQVIDIVNQLYTMGKTIILFTARGSETGIDWKAVTLKQMAEWNVKYSELIMGKPNADAYIDDKAVTLGMLMRLKKTLDRSKHV